MWNEKGFVLKSLWAPMSIALHFPLPHILRLSVFQFVSQKIGQVLRVYGFSQPESMPVILVDELTDITPPEVVAAFRRLPRDLPAGTSPRQDDDADPWGTVRA